MRKSFLSLAFPILIGSSLASQALAFESLLGEYQGKIKLANGYGAKVDEACSASIVPSDLYGGAISFEIQGIEKLTVEKRRVENDLKGGVPEVTWVTPGKPTEIVTLGFGDNGTRQLLKLLLKTRFQHQEKTVVCAELTRRQ